MKKVFMWSLMLLSLGLNLTSCSSNDDPIIINDPVTLSLEMPLNLENVEVTNSNITLTNVSSSQIHVLNNAIEKTSNAIITNYKL